MEDHGLCPLRLELERPASAIPKQNELHRCLVELHRCVVELQRCIVELHRCVVELHRCVVELHRCVSELHRCVVELHRCVVELHRCVVELHRCVSDSMCFNEIKTYYILALWKPPGPSCCKTAKNSILNARPARGA
jgi:hypothetical protein